MLPRRIPVLAVLLLGLAPLRALAQCPDWIPGPMDNGTGAIGTNGHIYALTVADVDGAGPLPPVLVVGGLFSEITGVTAINIAYLDPSTGQWRPFTSLPNITSVRALSSYNGNLVAGGDGNGINISGANLWNGTHWVAMDTDGCRANFTNVTPSNVRCFGYVGSTLCTGGNLTAWNTDTTSVTCTGQGAHGLAEWNGNSEWEEGPITIDEVFAINQFGGQLIIGGTFSSFECSCAPGEYIAAWNGSSWGQMGGGFNAEVDAMTLFNGNLVVAGAFTSQGASHIPMNHIAQWDGSWHSFGVGVGDSVKCLVVYDGELIAGGTFTTAGGSPSAHIARWNGSIWQPLGGGTDGTVRAMAVYGSELIAGGDFSIADGQPVNGLARWNGLEWAGFGGGTATSVLAMTPYLGHVVAGGNFHQSTNSTQAAQFITGWDGVTLSPLGTGMDGAVSALKAFKYSGLTGANELVAGGTFAHAGGVAASNIARWDQTNVAFPPPAWEAMGAGFTGQVNAIERYNNNTYAGGSFTNSGGTTVNNIARWNEGSQLWEALGTGMNGPVYALRVYNGNLYVGGTFTTANGVSTGGLTRFDGTNWTQVGGNFVGSVYALEVHNGQLVIGGDFAGINSSPDLAQYNGSIYSTFGTGGTNGFIRSLVSTGPRLYIGGSFTGAGNVSANNIAYWDGAWHDAGGGTNATVFALADFGGEIQAGGTFSEVKNAILAAPTWARYAETGLPWFAYQPNSQTVNQGDDVTFAAQAADGYAPLTFQWYRNGIAVHDGSALGGSVIGGTESPRLTLHGVTHYDEGSYQLIMASDCGPDTSSLAVLAVNWAAGVALGGGGATSLQALGPNPSRGEARLTFSLARAGEVRVSVHDVSGRRVRVLDLGTLAAGAHQSRWDGRSDSGAEVQAGVYFVGLEVAGREAGSRRVAIVR